MTAMPRPGYSAQLPAPAVSIDVKQPIDYEKNNILLLEWPNSPISRQKGL